MMLFPHESLRQYMILVIIYWLSLPFAVSIVEKIEEQGFLQGFQNVSISNSQFSTNLFQILRSEEPEKNVVFSSLGIQIILSSLLNGAAGITKQELKSGLSMSNFDQMKLEWSRLLSSFMISGKNDLEIANAIFLDNTLELLPEFVTVSRKEFGTSVKQIDFQDSANSVIGINAWASGKTKQKIQHVIKNDDIDEYTKVILVNALYFKSNWLSPFELELSEEEVFHNMDKTNSYIPMMFQKVHIPHGYIERLDVHLAKMPYVNKDFEMVILLPVEQYGLRKLEKEFDWNFILNASLSITSKHSKLVHLRMPKFDFEFRINLKKVLQKLGIHSLFEEKANLSLISKEPLYIDKILQKACIGFDEKGSEAAAATVASIRSTRSIVDFEYFVMNHPFMFVIHHKPSQIPLFIGSVRRLETKTGRRLRIEL